MNALRQALRDWWGRVSWARRGLNNLARDIGAPRAVVSRILDQTQAELLAAEEVADFLPIVSKASNQLARYHCESQSEATMLDRFLNGLPDRDYDILRHFKGGMKHGEIATLMGTDVESVRRSLIKTYADLRMLMITGGGDGDELIQAIEPERPQLPARPIVG